MPRHDWRNDDDFMTRDDRERGYSERGRDRDRMFSDDRGESGMRRERMGGWGSLLNDEGSGARDLGPRGRSDYRQRNYGPDDNHRGIATDETERLIASNKVEGTPVYGRNGDRLGSIHNFMVDKFRGRVVYAVLKYGRGFLGLDERYYPLEWDQLRYDERLGGYHVDMSEDDLTGRGSWDRSERWQERSREFGSDRDRSDREHMAQERSYDREMRQPW